MQIGVITNPNSKKNQEKQHRAEALQSIVGNLGQVVQTPSPGDIKPVLRDFLRQRARYWVSDGGDGALHWMLKMGMEVLQEDEFRGYSLPVTMPTNGGSIDFVAHNAGLRGNAESLLGGLRHALENDQQVEEVEVDSMLCEGIELVDGVETPFRTLGFASAAGGVGQRFFEKLFEAGNHTPATVLTVLAKTLASFPVAMSPLQQIPGMPQMLRDYARDVFRPTMARVTIDGMVLPRVDCTGIHIASMSINLGNVFRLFSKAERPGKLHALVGSPSPAQIIRNLPRLMTGREVKASDLFDGACEQMTIESVGRENLGPIIDGEYYPNLRKLTFRVGPRLRIPKVVARALTSN